MKHFLFLLSLLAVHSLFAATEDAGPQTELLQRLVTASSGTNDIEGVRQVQNLVAEELKKLGFQTEFLAAAPETKSRQLVATLKGKKPQFITFVGHADTVFEKLNHFEISSDGKRIKGSGVGDDKGGMVVGLFAIRDFLKKSPLPQFSLRFVISPTEEIGSMGFRERLHDYAKDSVLVLGLEPALGDGSIVKARKGVRWYQINVHGLEAHAGVNPENGVNACQQLSLFVTKISALTNFKTGNTVSVGHIEGGKDKFNIVCGEAQAKIDFRFVDAPSRDVIHRKIEALLKNVSVGSEKLKTKAKVDWQIVTEVPAFAVSSKSASWIRKYQRQVAGIEGKAPAAILTGGAADLNYMENSSTIMLDGLGPVGDGYHTIEEYIETASLATRAQALAQFLTEFNADQ